MELTDDDKRAMRELAESNASFARRGDTEFCHPHDPAQIIALLEENERLRREAESLKREAEDARQRWKRRGDHAGGY